MKIQLSDHFNYKKLLSFVLPSVVMMVFTSIYCVVDGFFISNFVGITEFAAVNLIMPFIQITGCFGFMLGAGGSALIAKTLGEKDNVGANRIFSLLTYVAIGLGVVISVLSIIFIEPIALLLGADQALLPFCVKYGRMVLITLPAFMLQNMFQSFFITAEKPTLGLLVTVLAGVTNMVLDVLLVLIFPLGVLGAATATCVAQCVGGFIPLFYFFSKNKSLLRLGKAKFDGKALLNSCFNGSSEFVTNISMSVVSIMYNYQLMIFAGEDGIAAYGAVMYVGFMLVAVFLGYSIGVSPLVAYNYGAKRSDELKNLYKKSKVVMLISGVFFAVVSFVLAEPLSKVFLGIDAVNSNPHLIKITVDAFRCYAIGLLFCGFSIFGSAFFTALNNGLISAIISFLRMFLFQAVCVLLLPKIFGIDGIWYSMFGAEVLAVVVTFALFVTMRKKYDY